MSALLLRFWKPLACVAAVLLALWALHHFGASRFSAGYQQAISENAKALAEWQIKYDAQVKADEKRVASAHMAHEIELGLLAAASDKPLPRVVCHSTASSAGPVSAATVLPDGGSAAAVVVHRDADLYPDITGALQVFALRADKLAADARELNTAVNSPPQ